MRGGLVVRWILVICGEILVKRIRFQDLFFKKKSWDFRLICYEIDGNLVGKYVAELMIKDGKGRLLK